MNDELCIMIALVRKLGGHVELTVKDLVEATDYELERSENESFTGVIKYRTRLAPVTVEGELVNEVESPSDTPSRM